MFRILIDTCVWLDLIKDPKQQTLLNVLDHLIRKKEVELIIPRTVVTEFNRNKDRVAQETTKGLSSVFKRVKEVVDRFGDPRSRSRVLKHLNDIDHKIPLVGGVAADLISHIEFFFKSSTIIEESNEIKLRAAQRAIEAKAPFHRQKNSIGDAIILEVYAECLNVKDKSTRFAFVTHNVKDFSDLTGNQKHPHPDIAPLFSKIRSLYFIALAEALHRVRPALVSDLMLEYEVSFEPRSLAEIQDAISELVDKIWYNRYRIRNRKIR